MQRWMARRAADGVALGVICIAMFVLCVLAYRVPQQIAIKLGGTTHGAGYDQPFIRNEGWYLDKPDLPRPFRVASGAAGIRLPGVGSGPWALTLRLLDRPAGATIAQWRLAGEPLVNVPIAAVPRRYHIVLPRSRDDLALRMTTLTYADGKRQIAFVANDLTLASLSPMLPPRSQLGYCAMALGLGYGLLRLAHLRVAWATAFALAGAVSLGALLAWQRPALTLITPTLVVLLVVAHPLWALLWWLFGQAARYLRLAPVASTRAIATLVVLAWLLRVVGLFHPQALNSDVTLHTHNLQDVINGKLIFTEPLPARAGGGVAPYPAAGYVTLAPFALLKLPNDTLTKHAAALVDSLTVGGLWLLCMLAGLPPTAAVLGSTLYLLPPSSLNSLLIGEMANVWGQALTLPLVVVLLGRQTGKLGTTAVVGTAAVALMGHFGVFLSLLALFGCYGVLVLVTRTPHALQIIGALLVVTVIVITIYYTAWIDIMLHRPTAPPDGQTGVQRVGQALRAALRPDDDLWVVLYGLGLAGVGLLWRKGNSLRTLALAWWLATAAGLAPLLFSGQALRWQLWLFPFAALCGGVALAALWARGRAGQSVVLALVAFQVLRGGYLWIDSIATRYH